MCKQQEGKRPSVKVALKLSFEGQGASREAELGSESGPSGLKEQQMQISWGREVAWPPQELKERPA